MTDEIKQLPVPPTPPKPVSLKSLLLFFVVSFIIIIAILNAPSLVKAAVYPFTHSQASDDEQLTQEYRDLYGYDKNPQLVMSAERLPVVSSVPGTAPVAREISISIPKINVTAPVLQVADASNATILNALKNGVVLFPGSSVPGQPGGTTVIVGHSSSNPPWTKYSAIFSLLSKLQADDLIYVTVDGVQHTYRVNTVQKGNAQQLLAAGLGGDLVISTCWPVGTDQNRMAVSATLLQ